MSLKTLENPWQIFTNIEKHLETLNKYWKYLNTLEHTW
jgi:hypothetical protein